MAKRGRKSWIERVDAGRRRELELAIDSAANESAASIYERFGLATLGVPERTFRRLVEARRGLRTADAAAGADAGRSGKSVPELISELRVRAITAALEQLDAGNARTYEVAQLLAKVHEYERTALLQSADERDAEKHAAWRDELRKRKAAADSQLDAVATARGIPDDVAQRIKDIYGIVT